MRVNEKMTAIADAIREKTGGTEKLTLDEMSVQIGSIKVEKDWSKYAYTIGFKNLNLFGKPEVVFTFDEVEHCNEMFTDQVSNTTVKHLTVNISTHPRGAYNMFRCAKGDLALERLTLNVDFSKAASCGHFLYYRNVLKVVDGTPIDFSSLPVTARLIIEGCAALEEIRFVPNTIKTPVSILHSPLLSAESIQSIIDGLADLTGQTAQTLTLHADVGAKLTDAQKATITVKNWTLVY